MTQDFRQIAKTNWTKSTVIYSQTYQYNINADYHYHKYWKIGTITASQLPHIK